MGTYFVILTCRDSENIIEEAVNSLKRQTQKPEYIIIINDGSKDKTAEILEKLQRDFDRLYVITNPDLGYDVTRIVSNWNKAIKLTDELKLVKTDYHMIATDDTIYEDEYCEKIIKMLDVNSKIAIASGDYGDYKNIAPHGAGRFVRTSFFDIHHQFYPEKLGYESLVLFTAVLHGYTYKIFNNIKFKHVRQLGKDHHFYEFGASMRTLGYHPLFVIGRFFLYFLYGKPLGRKGAIFMFYSYLTFSPKESGYYSLYDKEIRKFISDIQCRRIKKIFRMTGYKKTFSHNNDGNKFGSI